MLYALTIVILIPFQVFLPIAIMVFAFCLETLVIFIATQVLTQLATAQHVDAIEPNLNGFNVSQEKVGGWFRMKEMQAFSGGGLEQKNRLALALLPLGETQRRWSNFLPSLGGLSKNRVV